MEPAAAGVDNLGVFALLALCLLVFVCSLRVYRGLGMVMHAIGQAMASDRTSSRASSGTIGVTSPIRGRQAA